jgi:hypothetical protein
MTRATTASVVLSTALLAPAAAFAADISEVADRLTLSGAGLKQEAGDGTEFDGGNGSIGWLHNFNSNTLLGVAANYQKVADAHWSYGTLNFSHGMGQASRRSTLYAEANQGSGEDNVHSYDYGVYTLGLYQNVTRQLSLQFEGKQVDVDTVSGNLAKVGVQYLWSPRFISAVGYQLSTGGGLGTRLISYRFDLSGKAMTFIVGGANGEASPVTIDRPDVARPGTAYQEHYIGVSRAFSRADFTVLADYLNLGDNERYTLTLNCTIHLRRPGAR